MWEEASVRNKQKHIQFLNASRETPPGAVCNTDRSTGVGFLNTAIVIYTVIFYKVPYRLKNLCTTQLYCNVMCYLTRVFNGVFENFLCRES